jgi:hypothetical protein
MALIKCLECGKEVSDKAKSCINCGCPFEQLRTDGNVKIKMPRNMSGTLNLFGGFNTCLVSDIETGKELWSGKHGQVAEFYLSKITKVKITFGKLSNPLEYSINPAGNANYNITQDLGAHLYTTYNISRVDIV